MYRKYLSNNKAKIGKINELMTSLYALYDFRESLRNESRTYIEKYNCTNKSITLTVFYFTPNISNCVTKGVWAYPMKTESKDGVSTLITNLWSNTLN